MTRKHRVGTVTLGCVLIFMGGLCMAHMIFPSLSYVTIFRLWPVILIALGVEVLLAQGKSDKVEFIYDGWAVVMMILLIFFAMCMAVADTSIAWHLDRM